MKRIFISYRREDSSGYTGRLRDALVKEFSAEDIFQDIQSIRPGENFVEVLEEELSQCDVFLIVIGEQWASIKDRKKRRKRLADPADYVHLEVATALGKPGKVIPVLVNDADMPKPGELPQPLAKLAKRQAISLSDDRWDYDVQRLVKTIRGEEKGKPPWWKMVAGSMALVLVGGWGLCALTDAPFIPHELCGRAPVSAELEKNVRKLKEEVVSIWGSFESIKTYDHSQSDAARERVEKNAAALGQQLAAIQDRKISFRLQYLKYTSAALAFAMAASVEQKKDRQEIYADKAIQAGTKALAMIEEAAERASSGDKKSQVFTGWLRKNLQKDYLHYLLAVANAIKVRNGDDALVVQTKKHLAAVSSVYLNDHPDRNISWFQQNWP